jgi:glycerol-3-phosphate O-acyltransferase
VNFGTPLSVKTYCRQRTVDFSKLDRARRFPEVANLCRRLMQSIADVIPILPVSLVSTVFLANMDTEMDVMQIEQYSNNLIKKLQNRGAPILEIPRSTRAHAVADAIDFMLLRRMIRLVGERLHAVPEEERLIRYYANAIAHWL